MEIVNLRVYILAQINILVELFDLSIVESIQFINRPCFQGFIVFRYYLEKYETLYNYLFLKHFDFLNEQIHTKNFFPFMTRAHSYNKNYKKIMGVPK